MRFTLSLALSLALILLSACVPPQKELPPQLVDDSFDNYTMRWGGSFRGSGTKVYIKTFDHGGMLAVCALRDEGENGLSEQLNDAWFDQASVYVGRSEPPLIGSKPVASAKFIAAAPDYAKERWANCIETKTPSGDIYYHGARINGGAIEVWN